MSRRCSGSATHPASPAHSFKTLLLVDRSRSRPRNCHRRLTCHSTNCIIVVIQEVEIRRGRFLRWGEDVQIHISATDGVPIYQQIVNQVKYLIASGRLAAGEELPPIRVLAERLLVNPNTVARAYRELESAGVVEKRRTAGTYVSEPGSPLARRERLKIISERVDALLAEARQLGIGVDELFELIARRDQAMQTPGGDEKP